MRFAFISFTNSFTTGAARLASRVAQRACAVDHSSGACAIEGAQAVSAQISAQMELSYRLRDDALDLTDG